MSKKKNLILALIISLFTVVFLGHAEAQEQENKGIEIQISGHKAWVWASSDLASEKNRYSVEKAFDGNPNTAWVEGAEDAGEGSFLVIEYEEPVVLEGFVLRPGYVKNERVFTANGTPRTVEVQVDARRLAEYSIQYELSFEYEKKAGCYHTGTPVNLYAPRVVIFTNPVKGRIFRLTMTEVNLGNKYSDIAIAEWEPITVRGDSSRFVDPQIIGVLKAARGENVERHLAPEASIEDLRRKYVHRDPGKGYIFRSKDELERTPQYDFPYFPRVEPSALVVGDNVEARFLRYTRQSFIDAAVTIYSSGGSTYILGSRSFRHGDGEWLDFYPIMKLNKEFLISSIYEKDDSDGSPGCRRVIPSSIERSVE
jgi:hypothetical protein